MGIFDDLQLAPAWTFVAVNPGADRDVAETPQREGFADLARAAATAEQAHRGQELPDEIVSNLGRRRRTGTVWPTSSRSWPNCATTGPQRGRLRAGQREGPQSAGSLNRPQWEDPSR
jgi:hypothetical protein